MTSNLGSAKEEKDLNKILDEVRDFAGGLIGSSGGFPPFGATVSSDGQVGLIMFQAAPGISGQEFVDRLAASVREQAVKDKLRAACVAYMVSMEVQAQRVDAIVAAVQHRSGKPLEVVLPFTKSGKTAQFWPHVVKPGSTSFF